MDLHYSIWFAAFASLFGLATVIARLMKWSWAFGRLPDGRFWEPRHVVRYTISPFVMAGVAYTAWFAA